MKLAANTAHTLGVAINSLVIWDRAARDELAKPESEYDGVKYALYRKFYNDAVTALMLHGITSVRKFGEY